MTSQPWTDASHEALWREQLEMNANTIKALQGAMQRIKALEARVEELIAWVNSSQEHKGAGCYWCASADCQCPPTQ